jgi:hypothetical protein
MANPEAVPGLHSAAIVQMAPSNFQIRAVGESPTELLLKSFGPRSRLKLRTVVIFRAAGLQIS